MADIESIKSNFPKDEYILDLADFFKVFSDSTRVKILYALDQGELCVNDIATILNMTVSAVSHQLKILRTADLVNVRRNGKELNYSLADDHVKKIIECASEHLEES